MKPSRQAVKEKILKRFKDVVEGAVKPMLDLPVRKTFGETGQTDSDEKEYFSIAKYIWGMRTGSWKDAKVEETWSKKVAKALVEGTGTAAGMLVLPEYVRDEIIDLLRAKAVVRAGLNPTVVPMSSDTLTWRRQTGASTANWTGEIETKAESNLTVGLFQLVLKKLTALTRISNELLEDSNPAADTLVKNDIAKQIAIAEDLGFIQGTGGLQPRGIYNDPNIPTTTLGLGNGAVLTMDNIMDAMYQIEQANGTYTAWLMHPRSTNTIRKLKTTIGGYIYVNGNLAKKEPDTLLGLPVVKSTQIPTNLTFGNSGAVCSYAILGNWAEFYIGEKSGGLKFDVSTEEGNSFEKDETCVRGVLRVDCGVRQPNEFYIVKGIKES